MFPVPRVALALVVLTAVCACGGSSSSTGPRYSGPPLTVSFNPTQVSQGDQSTITIDLPTNALSGGMPLILTFAGVGVGADTSMVPADSAGYPLQATINVPGGSPDGTLTLTVSLPTLQQSASATLTIKDAVSPTVSAGGLASGLSGVRFYGNLLVAGTTDSIAVTANDNHLLGWLGWTLGSPTLGDSVQAAAATDSVMLPIAVPASLAGDSLTLTAFAIDADGNKATTSVPALASALTTHSAMSVPRGARIADMAFDSARGLVYLAKPDSQIVSVLSLGTMTYQTPIAVSGRPVAVDLTPGGDSLIVGLASPASLAVVSLTSGAHPVLGTLPFDTGSIVDTVRSMRVLADRRAFAIVAHPGGHSVVMSLDLGTGTSQALDSTGTSSSGIYECPNHIARSGDRTRALAIDCGGWGTVQVNSVLYSSATHADAWAPYWGYYISPGNYQFSNNVFTSASASGHIFYQIGHTVMDSTVAAAITGGADATYGAAIAPNGTDFYVGEGSSDSLPGLYLRYVLPHQLPSEIAIIPHAPYELAVSPDGSTLIGITADTISAIDLTHSTPASASQIARLRHLLRSRTAKPRVAAIEKPNAFIVRLPGQILRPIAVNRASPGS
jgi:hypothetical protein